MACESQQSRNTGASPSLPAKVPTTQGEWGQVREAFNQLAQQVRQARAGIGVNIMPYSYATFDGEALPTLSVSNATATLDTGAAIFGNGSLKLAVSGNPAIAYFGASATDYKHSLSPNSKWLLSAFVKASGASQDLKLGIKTANGTYSVAVITSSSTDTVTRVYGTVDLIDDDAQKCIPFVQVDESSGNVWFDGLMMEAIAEDTAYPSQFNYTMPPRDTLVGSLVMEGQSHIRLGQTAFDTGTGFWQGDDSGTPKMSMGDASNGWKWDGTTFTIRGTSVAGSYVITTGGNVRMGMTDWNAGTGFWLGDDGGTAKFAIGDSGGLLKEDGDYILMESGDLLLLESAQKFYWDGSELQVFGTIGGTFEGNVTGTIDSTVEIDDASLSDNVPIIETGSFTGTLTGFASATTVSMSYYKVDNLVFLYPNETIAETSNATTMTMTGLPSAITPAGQKDSPCPVLNGLSEYSGLASISPSSVLTFKVVDSDGQFLATGFNSSGPKGFNFSMRITYLL